MEHCSGHADCSNICLKFNLGLPFPSAPNQGCDPWAQCPEIYNCKFHAAGPGGCYVLDVHTSLAGLTGCCWPRPPWPVSATHSPSPTDTLLSCPRTFLENIAQLVFLFLTSFQITLNPLHSRSPTRAWPKLSSVKNTSGLPLVKCCDRHILSSCWNRPGSLILFSTLF